MNPLGDSDANPWGFCPKHQMALIGKARMCDECPVRGGLSQREGQGQTIADILTRTCNIIRQAAKKMKEVTEPVFPTNLEKPMAALVRIVPWGLGEAATALEFLVESLQ